MASTRFFTKAITSNITIAASDNVQEVSIEVVSGTCSITGNYSFRTETGSAISLSAGKSITLSANQGGAVLDGLTLAPAGGTTNIIMGF